MTTAISSTLPTTHRATRNPDGSWNVLDVPVFGEVPAKAKGGAPVVSREWLEGAVKRDAERRKTGYRAPLHIRHNKKGQPAPERAGEIAFKRVGTAVYDGAEIAVVFADYERVPDATFRRMERGELPYRSVEVLDMDVPEINSCALLDSEVPFFRFPNLSVSAGGAGAHYSARRLENSPTIACARPDHGRARGYLFHAAGAITMDKTADPAADPNAAAKGADAAPAAPDAAAVEQASERMFGLIEQVAEKVEGLAASFAAKFEALETRIGGLEKPPCTEPQVPVSPERVNREPESDPGAGAAAPKATAAFDAKAEGRILALEARLGKMETDKEIDARFTAALETLRDYNLSEDHKKRLRVFAAMGQEPLDTVVETFQASLPKDPPRTPSAAAGAASLPADPPAVAAYAADAGKLARARQFAAQYESLRGSMKCDLETYLKVNVENPLRTRASARDDD